MGDRFLHNTAGQYGRVSAVIGVSILTILNGEDHLIGLELYHSFSLTGIHGDKSIHESTLEGKMEEENLKWMGIGVAVIAIIITAVIWLYCNFTSVKRDVVAFIGLSNGGKTLIFHRLTSSDYVDTYTSIKENTGIFKDKNEGARYLHLIDIPGNDKLRFNYIRNQVSSLKGIVFVVDSLNIQRELRDVSSLLYDILANKVVIKNKVPVLIACNKQDGTTAKSQKVVIKLLEQEMDKLRITRTAALKDGNDNSEEAVDFIGKKGKDFEFSHVMPVRVTSTECNAKGDNESDADLTGVREWIIKLL
ncbi:Signal recognition particle receptor subunit beta [Trichoplax sp. H2]|nr:Signal recognition particle receptor subunit beta [Trichoplax sp. H2]|eukprot:RDD40506.1 Signal recognition particle receptor subunit beta [Trichoplax sp. H2]